MHRIYCIRFECRLYFDKFSQLSCELLEENIGKLCTHTHTHTHIYIYTYIYKEVSICKKNLYVHRHPILNTDNFNLILFIEIQGKTSKPIQVGNTYVL